jgi:inositol phosphorylceramide mannosyltransferase catalytic subunit
MSIPKVIHTIWIGNAPCPMGFINTFRKWNPDWTFFHWTDRNKPWLFNKTAYDAATKPAIKADILRLEVLYKYGGVYVDSDFLCLQPLDSLLDNTLFIGAERGYPDHPILANGCMGATASHSVMYQMIRKINQYTWDDVHGYTGGGTSLTGPLFVTPFMLQAGAKIYPPETFYPVSEDGLPTADLSKISDKSLMVHLWHHRWGMKEIEKVLHANHVEFR